MKLMIKRPLVTEKNTYHNAAGVYVFEVDMEATKADVKTAIEKNFAVKVEAVRTAICRKRAKNNKFGAGKVPYWKKALVRLEPGQKIALFEGA